MQPPVADTGRRDRVDVELPELRASRSTGRQPGAAHEDQQRQRGRLERRTISAVLDVPAAGAAIAAVAAASSVIAQYVGVRLLENHL